MQQAIAAAGGKTPTGTCSVIRIGGACIALFIALHDAIPATCLRTIVGAVIVINLVAVIASLNPKPHLAVAANVVCTRKRARTIIRVVRTSITLFLVHAHQAIPAASHNARAGTRAVIGIGGTFVALLIGLHNAIPADRFCARVGAVIVIYIIPIIAALPKLKPPIATLRNHAHTFLAKPLARA